MKTMPENGQKIAGTDFEIEHVRWSPKRGVHLFYLKRVGEPPTPRDSLGVPMTRFLVRTAEELGIQHEA